MNKRKNQGTKRLASPETSVAAVLSPIALGVLFFLLGSQIALFWVFNNNFPFSYASKLTADFVEQLHVPTLHACVFIIVHMFLGMLLSVVCYFLGRFGLAIIKARDLSTLEHFSVSILVGLAILGLALFGLGFVSLLQKRIFLGLTILVLSMGFYWLTFQKKWSDVGEGFKTLRVDFMSLHLKYFLIPFLLLPLFLAFVPEVFYDALVYHIGLPHLYLLEGRYVDMPNVQLSRFPLLIQSVYIYSLSLGGDSLAKLTNVLFLFIGVGLIIAIVRRMDLPRAAGVSALLVASIPVVQINVWTTAVDMSMSVYALGAFWAALVWWRSEENSWKWILLSGFLSGCVFSSKYTGVLFVGGMNGLLVAGCFTKKIPISKIIARLFVFNAVVFVVLLPWLVRNAIYSGNPVYPFLPSLFPNPNLVPEKIAAQSLVSKGLVPQSWWGWLLVPWTLSSSGQGGSFDFLGPAVVGLLPTVYFLKKKDHFVLGWVAFFALYFGAGFVLSRYARYLLPGVVLLAVFSGMGVGAVFEKFRTGFWSWSTRLFLFVSMISLFCWSVSIAQRSYAPQNVVAGLENRDAYRSYYHPGMNPYPPNNLFAAIASLPKDAKIMFLGEEKVFGCPRPFVYSNVYDKTPFVEFANTSNTPDELLQKIQALKISHLVINIPEAIRLKGYDLFPLAEEKKQLVQDFFQTKTKIVTIKDVENIPGLVLLSLGEGNPQQPTWSVLEKGLELALDFKKT